MIWLVVGLGLGVLLTFLVMRHPSESRPTAPAGRRRSDEPELLDDDTTAEAQRLAAIVRVLPIGVVIVDRSGEVAYRNDVADGLASGRHGDAIVEGRIRELALRALLGEQREDEVDLYGPPRRFLEFRASPIVEVDDPRPTSAVILIVDATEKYRTDVVRRDFVANVSHELKTPVGAIGVLAETLLDATDPEVVERLAGRLHRESLRLGSTIDDLLTLSSIEGGDGLERVPVPVATVVQATLDRVAPAAERRRVTVDVAPVVDATIVGDRRQLVSALANLVENAIKYSEPDSTVEVRARGAGVDVELSVADHGRGIPERDLARIFERFYRVDPARSRDTGGTGLGLSIVRNIVAAHDGSVDVHSVEGEGSVFTMRFPRAGAERAESPAAPDAERPGGAGESITVGGS